MFLIFDIGGSSTKIAILDEDTKIIKQKKVKSKKIKSKPKSDFRILGRDFVLFL